MMVERTEFPQKIQIRFNFFRREQGYTVFAGKESSKALANPGRSLASLASTHSTQALAHRITQERFIRNVRSGICHIRTIQ